MKTPGGGTRSSFLHLLVGTQGPARFFRFRNFTLPPRHLGLKAAPDFDAGVPGQWSICFGWIAPAESPIERIILTNLWFFPMITNSSFSFRIHKRVRILSAISYCGAVLRDIVKRFFSCYLSCVEMSGACTLPPFLSKYRILRKCLLGITLFKIRFFQYSFQSIIKIHFLTYSGHGYNHLFFNIHYAAISTAKSGFQFLQRNNPFWKIKPILPDMGRISKK